MVIIISQLLGIQLKFQAIMILKCQLDDKEADPQKLEIQINTWRNFPVSKWLVTMGDKSPKWGCSPSKWPKWL